MYKIYTSHVNTHRKAAVLWIIQNELLILLGGSKILLWTKINTKIYSKKNMGQAYMLPNHGPDLTH